MTSFSTLLLNSCPLLSFPQSWNKISSKQACIRRDRDTYDSSPVSSGSTMWSNGPSDRRVTRTNLVTFSDKCKGQVHLLQTDQLDDGEELRLPQMTVVFLLPDKCL